MDRWSELQKRVDEMARREGPERIARTERSGDCQERQSPPRIVPTGKAAKSEQRLLAGPKCAPANDVAGNTSPIMSSPGRQEDIDPKGNRLVPTMDPSIACRLQAIRAQKGIKTEYDWELGADADDFSDLPPPDERMRRKAADIRNQLYTFCIVGEVLQDVQKDVFVIGWMTGQLWARATGRIEIGDSTLRAHLKKVQKFFGESLPTLRLLWNGRRGQRGYEVRPEWWAAWRIAREILGLQMPYVPAGGSRES